MKTAFNMAEDAVNYAENSPAPEPLDIIDPVLYEGRIVPIRKWMVQNWMPWRHTTALYGDGGTGKTLLAQMLGTSCATGNCWLGLETTPCKVLGVFCEDDKDELQRRQNDINAAMNIHFSDLRNFRWLSRVGHDNLQMVFDAGRNDGVGRLTSFWHQIVAAAKEFQAQLIIIDTAADTFGGNENARPHVRQFIQGACTRLAMEIDGAVLLCAHPSVAGINSGEGSGGSTGWNNSVRSRWYLSRPKVDGDEEVNDKLRVLTKKKANYASVGDGIDLEWREGFFHLSNNTHKDTVDRIEEKVRHEAAEKAFLAALKSMIGQGRGCSHSPNAKNYAPKLLLKCSEVKGFTKRELTDAMERLFVSKRILASQEIARTGCRHLIKGIAPTDYSLRESVKEEIMPVRARY